MSVKKKKKNYEIPLICQQPSVIAFLFGLSDLLCVSLFMASVHWTGNRQDLGRFTSLTVECDEKQTATNGAKAFLRDHD